MPLAVTPVRPLSAETQKVYHGSFPGIRRFYVDGQGVLFGVQLRRAELGVKKLVLLRLHPKTKEKELVAAARIQFLPGKSELFLFEGHHGNTFPSRSRSPKTKGIGFFRVLVNEATLLAKEHGMDRIALETRPPRLRSYYALHGFRSTPKPNRKGQYRLTRRVRHA